MSLDTALSILEDEAKKILPRGYTLDYAGESRQLRTEGTKFLGVFLLSAILIYLVLAAQFESFRDPFIILARLGASGPFRCRCCSLPRADVDQHLQSGRTDHAGRTGVAQRHPHRPVRESPAGNTEGQTHAVLEAAGTRLRPILMTTAATVMGHLPLVFARGPAPARATASASCSSPA